MNRREFVVLAGSLLASPAPFAQEKPVRIGVLAPLKRPPAIPAILKRLGDLGFIEGKNLSVQFRSTDGVAERFPALARELVQAGCKLIFAHGTEHGARAWMQACSSPAQLPLCAHDHRSRRLRKESPAPSQPFPIHPRRIESSHTCLLRR